MAQKEAEAKGAGPIKSLENADSMHDAQRSPCFGRRSGGAASEAASEVLREAQHLAHFVKPNGWEEVESEKGAPRKARHPFRSAKRSGQVWDEETARRARS